MNILGSILLVLLMLGALFVIPFGFPGTWIMILVLLGVVLMGEVTWVTWGILAGLALLAELIEWATVAWFGKRYGGSDRAFWGALAGGIVGMLVGMPVPFFGPILAGIVGTFGGAAAVTLYETRSVETASRVGWGTALARIIAVGVKVGVGVVVLIVGGGALFL